MGDIFENRRRENNGRYILEEITGDKKGWGDETEIFISLYENIIGATEITTRFKTTIPKCVREKLGIKKKDRVLWIEENGKIVVKKA